MDSVDTVTKLLIITSGLALPLGILAAICSFLQTRKSHLNLRILDFVLCMCYVSLPLFALLIFAADCFGSLKGLIFNLYTQIPLIIRYTGIGICIERGLATMFAKTYENDPRFWIIDPIILLFVVVMSSFEKLVIVWCNQSPFAIYGFNLVVNIIYFLSAHKLFIVNMKKTMEIEKFNLSRKFQNVENVKMLKLFKCQAFIDVGGGLSATIIGLLIGRLNDPMTAAKTFYLIYDGYIIFTACHWIYRQTPKKLCHLFRINNKVHEFPQRLGMKSKVLTVKTVLGKEIQADATIDGHFEHLKNSWNKM
uniref:Gustatory receptor n=1 Tax=Panagrolaimus sp. JU765 TaxID=591449 RepID=A0AC34PZZ7_9BILA